MACRDVEMGVYMMLQAEPSSGAFRSSSMPFLPNFLQRLGGILGQERRSQAPFAAVWSRLLTLHVADADIR